LARQKDVRKAFPVDSLRGRSARFALSALVSICGLAPATMAQVGVSGGEQAPEWVKRLAIDPESSQAKKYAQQQKARVAAEKELRKLRVKYFGPIRKAEIRQEGLIKLREYSDPALFPSLVEIFEREQTDVRTAVLDILAESKTQEGDTSLTWVGIFDTKPEIKAAAITRLKQRIKDEGETPQGVKLVCYQGIVSGKVPAMAASADLAVQLNMLDAIPWMINAQVQVPQGSGAEVNNGSGNGALAWILVGTQTAFVSDLTPVVGPSAVAFDPELSVITEGAILRVIDAVVISYNLDIHNALNRLGSAGMDGADLSRLGWNIPAWREWYANEFLPYQAKKKAAAKSAQDADKAKQPESPVTPPPGKGG